MTQEAEEQARDGRDDHRHDHLGPEPLAHAVGACQRPEDHAEVAAGRGQRRAAQAADQRVAGAGGQARATR